VRRLRPDAAKMNYPDSIMDSMKYKRACKKAYEESMGKECPFARVKAKVVS